MQKAHLLLSANQLLSGLFLIFVGIACASMPASTPASVIAPTLPNVVITPQPELFAIADSSPAPALQIPGLVSHSEFDGQHKLLKVRYYNSIGVEIAAFDPNDQVHNQHILWYWNKLSEFEKSQVLRWLIDPHQMRYCQFENQEYRIIDALTKWIPQFVDFALPSDPAVAIHWQSDGPPMNKDTLYEALSRVKALRLVRERRLCSYGHSHLGLIEYGGEIVLFTAPGWQKVSAETREILTTAWTIKEAMVIYYPQSQGWSSSCPNERDHLKTEYYSSIWLVKAEQMLAKLVPSDKSYWEGQEIPFQIRNIVTQTFPQCLPPVPLPLPTPDPGCFQMPSE